MTSTTKTIYFALIHILFLPTILAAQSWLPVPIEIPEYNFLEDSKNTLVVPHKGDSTLLNNFFARYDTLLREHKGKLSIVHIGGSHVQAGVLTDQIRLNLNNNDFSAARGYIFPYKVARTNNPHSYSVSYNGRWRTERCVKRTHDVELGVGGIAVYTDDVDADIKISLPQTKSIVKNYYQRIKLLGYVKDGADWAVMPVIKINNGLNQIFYPNYDYVDNSHYTFDLRGNYTEFNVYFQQLDTVIHTFVVTGFVLENDEPGIVYHAIGTNGAAVPSYLGCERFDSEISVLAPDMVVFGIGINDAVPTDFDVEAFKNNYNTLMAKIRKSSPNCVFVFITNNDSYRKVRRRRYAPNSNAVKVQKAMYELAIQNRGAVFDQFELMGGMRSMRKWQAAKMAKRDLIHFTPKGYQLLGDLFYNAFINYYLGLR